MNNYYFTYLMQECGTEKFKKLMGSVLTNGNIKGKIEQFNMNDWNFIYFFSVYFCVALNYFGVETDKIEFALDIAVAPGWSKMFNCQEILELQKDLIPEIEKIIQEEYDKYYK